MSFTRRSFLTATGSAGALALLAACGGKTAGTPGDSGGIPASGDPNATVSFWSDFTSADELKYFQAKFADTYPGPGKPQILMKSTDTIDKLIQTSLAAGSGPSLVHTPGPSTNVPEYAKAGYLEPLDDWASKFTWRDKFAPWALEASTINGKLMSLPTQYESMIFIYVPEVLQKAGLAVPTTQGEFEEFCTEAKAKGMIPLAAGNADWKGANEWYVGVWLNSGAGPEAVYSALRRETKWTDPVFVSALTNLATYCKQGWFSGSVNNYFTTKFPSIYSQLSSGKAAAYISGSWEFANLPSYFKDDPKAWDWAVIPSLGNGVPGGIFELAIGQSVAINAKARDLYDSVSFLNYISTTKSLIVDSIADVNFEPTPIQLTSADFGTKVDSRVARFYTQYSSATNVGYTTWTFWPQRTETYIIDYWEKVITGQLSVADYCKGIDDQFAQDYAAGAVPPAPKPAGSGK